MMKPTSFTLRWWHIVIVAVALLLAALVSTAFIWRAMGHAHYVRVIQQLKDQGLPASIDDYMALAPPVNAGLQDQWDAWQKSIGQEFYWLLPHYQKEWDTWVTGNGPRPSDIETGVEVNATRFAPALPLLRQGDLVLSSFGWIVQDLPPGKRRQPFTSTIRAPNLPAIRDLAQWLHLSAVLAKDPMPHLTDLDTLNSAMKRPATANDTCIAIVVADIRDRTYVELNLQGRLPDDYQQRWLSEPCSAMHMIGDAAEGESFIEGGMSFAGMLDQTPLLGTTDIGYFGYQGWRQHRNRLHVWLTGYNDCALSVEFQTHVAQRLRGQTTIAWPDFNEVFSRFGPLGERFFYRNIQEGTITALHADADHRMARLAAQVIGLHRMGMMPTTQEALVTALGNDHALTPAGDHLHLRYEVPAPDRFRFVIDPVSPLPNFDDPKSVPKRTKAAGKPAAREPFVWTVFHGPPNLINAGTPDAVHPFDWSARSGSLEIQLAPTARAP